MPPVAGTSTLTVLSDDEGVSPPTAIDDVNFANILNSVNVVQNPRKSDAIMTKKVQEIISSYKETFELTGTSGYDDLIVFFQNGGYPFPVRWPIMMPIVRKMTEEFRAFAFRQR